MPPLLLPAWWLNDYCVGRHCVRVCVHAGASRKVAPHGCASATGSATTVTACPQLRCQRVLPTNVRGLCSFVFFPVGAAVPRPHTQLVLAACSLTGTKQKQVGTRCFTSYDSNWSNNPVFIDHEWWFQGHKVRRVCVCMFVCRLYSHSLAHSLYHTHTHTHTVWVLGTERALGSRGGVEQLTEAQLQV